MMDWGIISAIIAIILFIVSVTLSLRLVRKKRPVWAYRTINIIGLGTDAPRELQLTYDGKPVRDVYRTTIIVFNNGSEPIRANDVTAPITISLAGGEILSQPTIKARSNDEINFSAKQTGNSNIVVDFQYLDHNDGAVFDVIHTAVQQISCGANIIGAKKIAYKGEFEDVFPRVLRPWSVVTSILGIIGISLLVAGWRGKLPFGSPIVDFVVVASIIFGMFFVATLGNVIPLYFRSRKFPTWSRGVTKTRIATDLTAAIPAYCVRCRAKKIMKDPRTITSKSGKSAIQGVCPDCGTKMFRIGLSL